MDGWTAAAAAAALAARAAVVKNTNLGAHFLSITAATARISPGRLVPRLHLSPSKCRSGGGLTYDGDTGYRTPPPLPHPHPSSLLLRGERSGKRFKLKNTKTPPALALSCFEFFLGGGGVSCPPCAFQPPTSSCCQQTFCVSVIKLNKVLFFCFVSSRPVSVASRLTAPTWT